MKTPVIAKSSSADHQDFNRSLHLQPRAIAIQALCMSIVVFDFAGAVMGLSDIVIVLWGHHPLLAVASMAAAILLFAGVVEYGMASLQAEPAQIIRQQSRT
jgi:hypothetical protein